MIGNKMTPGATERAAYNEQVLKYEEKRRNAMNDAEFLDITQRALKKHEGKTTQQLATEAVVALTLQANMLNTIQGDLRAMTVQLRDLQAEVYHLLPKLKGVGNP